VLRGKQDLATSKELCRNLFARLKGDYSTSHRCSTHIHIDCQSLTPDQRLALVLLLIAHDPFFYKYGTGREANNFCCPVLYSPSALVTINQTKRAPLYVNNRQTPNPVASNIPSLFSGDNKYTGVNTMPLYTLGTVELRHFHPLTNMKDLDAVLDKVAILYEHALAGLKAVDYYPKVDPTQEDACKWVRAMLNTHDMLVPVEEATPSPQTDDQITRRNPSPPVIDPDDIRRTRSLSEELRVPTYTLDITGE
jgi:hypothetical protein